MATGGDDRRINLWNIGKAQAVMSLSGHSSAVSCVAFDGNEDVLVAGSAGGTNKIWDLEQQKVSRTFAGHKSHVTAIDFHPHGEYFASVSQDTLAKLWDIRHRTCVATFSGHTGSLTCARFTPDGRMLVTGDDRGDVMVWDLTAGKRLHVFDQHAGNAVSSIAFHPNEFLLATGGADRVVRFFDLESLEEVSASAPELTRARSVCFSPDGRFLFASFQESLKVLTWEPVEVRDSMSVNWPGLLDTAFVKDQFIGCASHANRVCIWLVPLCKIRPFADEQQRVTPPPSAAAAAAPPSSPRQLQPPSSGQQKQPKARPGSPPSLEVDAPLRRRGELAMSDAMRMLNDTHRPQSRAKRLLEEDKSPDTELPAPEVQDQPPAIVPVQWTRSPVKQIAPLGSAAPQPPVLAPPASAGGVIHVHGPLEPIQRQTSPPAGAGYRAAERPPTSAQQGGLQPPGSQSRAAAAAAAGRRRPAPAAALSVDTGPTFELFVPSGPPPSQHHAMPPTDRERPLDVPVGEVAMATAGTRAKDTIEDQIITEIEQSHETMSEMLVQRLKKLKVVRSLWSTGIKDAIEALIGIDDLQVTCDVLTIMLRKPDLFTLERAALLVPSVNKMLDSTTQDITLAGLNAMTLFATSFGQLIKTTLDPAAAPSGAHFEPSKEDRIDRCRILVAAFTKTQPKLASLSRRGGKLGQQSKSLAAKLRELNLP